MRLLARSLLAAALVAVTACDSDIIDGLDGDPNVTSMRLSVGPQTVTINSSGSVSGGPITLGAGSTVNVTATFLTSDGDPDPNVTQASFQLNVSSGGGISFQRNNVNPFAGTLTAGGTGSTQLSFGLYNIDEQQYAFGPWPVPVVVN